MIDILNKRYTDPRFINNDYLTFLTFLKKYSFHIFCDFIS